MDELRVLRGRAFARVAGDMAALAAALASLVPDDLSLAV
jgi:hypothetical protein